MTVTEYQSNLFEQVELTQPRLTLEQSFSAFCRRNPTFMRELARMTYDERLKGHSRVSVKALFEKVRSEGSLNQVGPWRLNNSWTALAARRLVELYPDLDGAVEMRKRRSA